VVGQGREGLWNAGGDQLRTLVEIVRARVNHLSMPLRLAAGQPTRLSRPLPWVDDAKARRELRHANSVSFDATYSQRPT
jgi:hypothetical protein